MTLNYQRVLLPLILLSLWLLLGAAQCFGAAASQLQMEQHQSGNVIITEYKDQEGQLVKPDDLLYARLEQTVDKEGRVVKEMYYDSKGKSVRLWGGQFGTSFSEFDRNGRPCLYTYLDAKGRPTLLTSGYCKTRYTRDDQTGRILTEMYLDQEGQPVMIEPGVYGYRYKGYDDSGRARWMICLNLKGKDFVNRKGYAAIRRTFDSSGTLTKEMYYDLDGRPVDIGQGQYGTGYRDGEKICLGADGKETFILSAWLMRHLWVVVLAALLLAVASTVVPVRGKILIGALYVAFILYMTLAFRSEVVLNLQTEVFWSYRQWFTDPELRREIIENILLFLPLGYVVGNIITAAREGKGRAKSKAFGTGLAAFTIAFAAILLFSVCIEGTQYLTNLGLCEIDDIISNGLGGLIGLAGALAVQKIKRKIIRSVDTNEM